MILRLDFERVVLSYFNFLIREFNYNLKKVSQNGNMFYELSYERYDNIISVSYECYQDFLVINLYVLKNGSMPDYDDNKFSYRLHDLNKILFSFISKNEIMENNNLFSNYETENEFEIELLKSAKELRLCVKHINKIDFYR